MISICIPHFNFTNPTLFETLFLQCKSSGLAFEIIIVDDASSLANKLYLEKFVQAEFKIIYLDKNIGRSAIRNFLAVQAKYPYLLFLDADSEIIDNNFIANYAKNFGDNIVTGGRLYTELPPTPQFFLHYKYGSQVEQYAQDQFQSNNFMLPKAVFNNLVFDEQIKGYGYEDVVFGLGAKKLGLQLIRINNPIRHMQLKTNEEFVLDMEQALQNLKMLIENKKDWRIEEEVNVTSFYKKLKKFRLLFLLSVKREEILRKARALLFLNIPIGSILLIAVYKLYYYHTIQIKN